MDQFGQTMLNYMIPVGGRVLVAIVIFVVGRRLIGLVGRVFGLALTRQEVDPTLQRYLSSAVTVSLNILLVIAILGYFGFETTSLAALIAGVGVALGAAWGGLLANFAARVFLVVLRPFKVGDYVAAGGVEGTVDTIGLFGTALNTPDNVHTIVGNNKIFSDTIRNFSVNPYRRVDRLAQLAHSVDTADAIRRLKAALAAIPNVVQAPPPDVEIVDFSPMGPVLAVRPYCANPHYWQVYFDTNRIIRDTCGEAGYPVPEQHYSLRKR
jgi:small conductance mechanosensitive channel